MEAITIKAMARELKEAGIPCRVQAVLQSSALDVVLSLRAAASRLLLVSVDPAAPSLHLTKKKPRGLASPTAFCRLLRKHLGGLVLTDVASPGMERTVSFSFGAAVSQPPLRRLEVELMGRWSNLVLVDAASGLIVDSLRHVNERMSRRRLVIPGEPYREPPTDERVHLDEVDEELFRRHYRRWKDEGASIFAPFVGLGPGLLALAEERAAADPLGRDGAAALLAALRSVIGTVREGRLEPALYPGRKRLLPLPVRRWEAEEHRLFATVSEAAEEAYAAASSGRGRDGLLARARRDLNKKLAKLREKERRVAGESAASGRDEEFLAIGRGLLASLGRIPKGAASFVIPEEAAPGGSPVEVQLDPSLGPRQNAEAYFKRARKARRRAELAGRRLPGLRAERERAERRLEELEHLSPEELERLVHPPPASSSRRPARAKPAATALPNIREYRSDEGWRILVGKSSKGNDYLSSRIAGPEDFWFHARDFPGAHVVLKGVDPKAEAPESAIRAAGEAAAYHSAARGEAMVDVAYTRRKHVRKVKGQQPGRVLVPSAATVRVSPRVPPGFREVRGKP